jgi:hypothetical protein
MQKDLNEIKIEISNRLNEYLNKITLNKERKKQVDDEIRSVSMKLFHFIFSQQVKIIKQTASIEKCLELNLIQLINKKKALLKRLECNFVEYDDIINDFNEIESLNSNLHIDFNYEFKKNEIIEKYLSIGDLLVLLLLLLFITMYLFYY